MLCIYCAAAKKYLHVLLQGSTEYQTFIWCKPWQHYYANVDDQGLQLRIEKYIELLDMCLNIKELLSRII